MSIAQSGENGVHFGKHLSAEHRKKIGDGQRGLKKSLEHKRKIGLANTGKKRTPEARAKMRRAHRIRRERLYKEQQRKNKT
jgi:hypothetical protein